MCDTQEQLDETGRALLTQHAPAMARRFGGFNDAVFSDSSTIPRKYKELIALGVALTTQCEGCLDSHTKAALAAGATEEELAETVYVAAAIRAGGALVHGRRFVMSHLTKADS
jgi:AhpD family alkylhydroperoxidase